MSIWNILRKHDEYFRYVWTFVNYVARNCGQNDNDPMLGFNHEPAQWLILSQYCG